MEKAVTAMPLHVISYGMRVLTENSTLLADNMTSTGEKDAYRAEYDDYYNSKWLLVLPRVSGALSVCAVCCVTMEAWGDIKARGNQRRQGVGTVRSSTAKKLNILTHIQLFYQIPLFCWTLAFALGTTTAPKGQDIWGAYGNTATCNFQGFLTQFGVFGSVGWDFALSTSYMMIVRYKKTERQLQSWVKLYHCIIWPMALAVSIYPLITGMYNMNNTVCWVETYPVNCIGDDCIRGEEAPLWQNIASATVVLHLCYCTVVMICLYCAIRNLEKTSLNDNRSIDNHTLGAASRQGSVTTASTNRRRYSRAIGIQGIIYASAMIFTCLPAPLFIVLWNVAGWWNSVFSILSTSLVPLVGYVNFIIYMRCRSVEQCHTRYAKFLRRMHSWIFDYDLVCHINCLRNPDTDTAMITPPDDNDSKDVRQQEERVNGGNQTRATHFTIGVKPKSQMPFVSELGQSFASGGSSTTGYEGLDIQDISPSIPLRQESRMETTSESPPNKPVRYISEVGTPEALPPRIPVRYTSEVSQHEPVIQERPPSLPVRFVSEVETPAVEGPPRLPERYKSELETVSRSTPLGLVPEEVPPTKPVRFLNEIDLDTSVQTTSELDDSGQYSKGSLTPSTNAPPTRPIRYVSEVEMPERDDGLCRPDAPPAQPLRYVSEAETSEFERDGSGSFLLPFSQLPTVAEVPLGASDGESIGMKSGATPKKSSIERVPGNNAIAHYAPPVKPTRFVSEVEIDV